MVLANKDLSGDNVGVKAADIRDAADFYRTRLTEIRTAKLDINAKIKRLTDRLALLTTQLTTLNANQNNPTSEIVVVVSADAAVAGKFTIQYLVYNAGWVPNYDMRAIDVNNPIELVYKANVWQTTGKDWANVALTLCTGNPTQSGERPALSTWYLSFYEYYGYYGVGRAAVVTDSEVGALDGIAFEADKKAKEETKTGADYTTVNEQQTNIKYEISIPYSIPCDGKYKIVEIQKNILQAQYEYYSAPKLDPDAFLMARVSGWDQYNLLPGEMNIFFEGTYLGKSYIDPVYTKDTLEISLGRDDNISITREKVKDLSSTKLIGTNTKETYTYEISVRNKKKTTVSVVIEDQLPVASDKDIVIEQLEISGAKVVESSGKLTWKFDLKPSETKKITLSYSVKYPKDKQINL